MNSLERVCAAVAFERVDRTPVIPQIFAHAAVLAGVPVADYVRDGALLARCQVDAWRHYGYDAVFAFMDAGVESEALASVLHYDEQQYPHMVSPALSPDASLEGLSIPDPQQAGRMPELLRAAALLRSEFGDEVPVIGVVAGPMTLAGQLMENARRPSISPWMSRNASKRSLISPLGSRCNSVRLCWRPARA